MSLLNDLRLDISDDDDVVYSSGDFVSSGVIEEWAYPDAYNEIIDLRLDIGDDDDIDYGALSGLSPFVEAPELWGYRIITDNTYTVALDDVFVFLNPTIDALSTITLPPNPVIGQFIIIKDIKGIASLFNITIDPGVYTIDGLNAFVLMQNKQSIMVTWNGTEWSIV